MKLDRKKKYEGWGLTFRRTCFDSWLGEDQRTDKPIVTAYDQAMQAWLDAGHVKPVKQTKIVRIEGFRLAMGRDGVPFVRGWQSFTDNHLVRESAETKPVTLEFEVEVDE